MKKNVYSVYDRKSKLFDFPWLGQNDNEAIRTFTQIVSQSKNLANFAEDYELHYIGTFDNETGILSDTKLRPDNYVVSAAAVLPNDLSLLKAPQARRKLETNNITDGAKQNELDNDPKTGNANPQDMGRDDK